VTSPPRVSLVCCGLIGTTIGDGFGQESMVERAFAEAIATQGVVSGTSDYARCMAQVNRDRGRSTVDVFHSLFPDNPVRAQAASLAFERSYRESIGRHGLTALPGADEAIDKLAGSGIKVCLITSLSRDMLTLILDAVGWRTRFDLLLAPGDAPRALPWPDLVITAVLRLGIADVREVAVASGHENGIRGGLRAGASLTAGILTGPHTATRMRNAGATHLVDTFATFPDLLALPQAP